MAKNDGLKDDRGALLILVAFALLALIAFASFSFDYGVLAVSRNQAQNAADAGAIAGGIALAGGGTDAMTAEAASKVVATNAVWGVAPAAEALFPATCPDGTDNSVVDARNCVRVNVFRDDANDHDNPLPMFFGSLVGLSQQNVRAMAIAQVEPANETDCLAPIAILNKSPTYTLATDLGALMTLTGDPWPGEDESGYHGYLAWGGTGANAVRNATLSCQSGVRYVGQDIAGYQKPGDSDGVTLAMPDLMGLDDKAEWDPSTRRIKHSCVESGTCSKYDKDLNLVPDPAATVSPRVLLLPVVDLVSGKYETMEIKGFLGFFVVDFTGSEVSGRLVLRPGTLSADPSAKLVDPSSAFLTTLKLRR